MKTLQSNLQDFFLHLQNQGKSQNTLKSYKSDLDCFISFTNTLSHSFDLSTFNSQYFNLYTHYLDYRYNSPNSKRRRIQALRMFFGFLLSKSLVNNNPVIYSENSQPLIESPNPASFNHIQTLWLHLSINDLPQDKLKSLTLKRNQIIFLLIYCAGLKVSDLSNLKLTDITILNGESYINNSQFYLPKIFTEIFTSYVSLLQESSISLDSLLFSSQNKQIKNNLSSRSIEIILKDYSDKLNINITPKSLRQACILKWINQEKNPTLIKKWLGHSTSYDLTMYSDMNKDSYNESFLLNCN